MINKYNKKNTFINCAFLNVLFSNIILHYYLIEKVDTRCVLAFSTSLNN